MQEHKYSIKEWAKDDRPREKLLLGGAENLSNSELLAILLRNGSRERSAVDLAKEIMKRGKNDIAELGKLSVNDLLKIKGIGTTKAATIAAALELGRRRLAPSLLNKTRIGSSGELARYLQAQLKDLRHEVFAVLFLNKANKINHFEIISEGGITSTVADPRIILRKALEEDAVSIILCHNHPSGSLRPSEADELLTAKIKEAASYFDIRLLDHIIVSEDGYFSFADEGRM
jgi:DNA repair protein RadC